MDHSASFAVDVVDEIAIVRVNRPPHNALRFRDWRDLPTAIAELEKSSKLTTMVITGLPGARFCAGNDRNEFVNPSDADIDLGTEWVLDAMMSVRNSRLFSVAAIHGAAVGSGFLLAACCDVRIATRDAVLGLPEVRAGVFGGYRIAREILPSGEARLTALTGGTLSAERAYQFGAVQDLVDNPVDLEAAAISIAKQMHVHTNPYLAQNARRLFNRSEGVGMEDGHDLERLAIIRLLTSPSQTARE